MDPSKSFIFFTNNRNNPSTKEILKSKFDKHIGNNLGE